MLTACNEKEEDMEEKIACLTITEATGSGEERVTTEQKFIYEDGKLPRTHHQTDLYGQTARRRIYA